MRRDVGWTTLPDVVYRYRVVHQSDRVVNDHFLDLSESNNEPLCYLIYTIIIVIVLYISFQFIIIMLMLIL